MSLPTPICPYYFHADLVWQDGPFKLERYSILMFIARCGPHWGSNRSVPPPPVPTWYGPKQFDIEVGGLPADLCWVWIISIFSFLWGPSRKLFTRWSIRSNSYCTSVLRSKYKTNLLSRYSNESTELSM